MRAAVLDGPSEPSATVFESIVRQTKGFEQTFGIYAQGCATTRPACHSAHRHAFLARLVARADAAPIPSRRAGEDRRADGAYVLDAVRAALTAEERWPDLDEILSETAFGNSAEIFAMIDNVSGPPIPDSAPADPADANYVINCNDSDLGRTDEQIHIRARAMARDYPLFGAHSAFNLFACKTWQRQRTVLEPPVARDAKQTVGRRHRPRRSHPLRPGAVALTKILGNANLLTWTATTTPPWATRLASPTSPPATSSTSLPRPTEHTVRPSGCQRPSSTRPMGHYRPAPLGSSDSMPVDSASLRLVPLWSG